MSHTLCTIYLCTMSDFPWHTYLPKNRTSFMNVPKRKFAQIFIYADNWEITQGQNWKKFIWSLPLVLALFHISIIKLAGQLTFTINFAFSFTQICWIHSFFAYVASEATFMPSFTGSPHQFSNEHLKMKCTVLEFCNFLYKKRRWFFLSSWKQHYDRFHIYISCTYSNTRTTDAQRGNSLHSTAEKSIPIPNF